MLLVTSSFLSWKKMLQITNKFAFFLLFLFQKWKFKKMLYWDEMCRFVSVASGLSCCFPLSGVRQRSRSPKVRLPGQAAVPHHHGSHSRGRPILPGGSILCSPAQQEMTDRNSWNLLRFRRCNLSSRRSRSLIPLIHNPSNLVLFCQKGG